MNRRTFGRLVLGAVPAAAAAVLPRVAVPQPRPASVKDFGARGDGTTDDVGAIRRALGSVGNGKLVFPAGDYRVTRRLQVEDFVGEVDFLPGARLVCDQRDDGGLYLIGGHGAILRNVRVTWPNRPDRRLAHVAGIWVQRTVDTRVVGCEVTNSIGAGILCDECVRPAVEGSRVADTTSDGIHFANCAEPRVVGATTARTGDDAVAFVNYRRKPDYRGGFGQFLEVRDSLGRGIAVVGQSDVEVVDFDVEHTAVSGIYCAMETFFDTRTPSGVAFRRGRIRRAGQMTPHLGNQFGIEVTDAADVTFESISTSGSHNRGISVLAPNGRVRFVDVSVDSPGRSNGAAISAARVEIDGLAIRNTPSYGIFVYHSKQVDVEGLRVVNAARADPLRRAVWFEQNGTLDVRGVEVVDESSDPTGYVLGFFGAQAGKLSGVKSSFRGGRRLRIENHSPRVTIE